MTTQSDSATGSDAANAPGGADAPAAKSRTPLLVGIIAVVALIAAIVFAFRRDAAPPGDEHQQTEP